MTIFWIVAALLIVAGLLFVIPPLMNRKIDASSGVDHDDINVILYKDKVAELENDLANGILTQEQYELAKEDLKRGLVQDTNAISTSENIKPPSALASRAAVVVVVFLLVAPVLLYLQLGSGERGLNPNDARVAVQAEGHQGTIEEQIRILQDRLQTNPTDLDGWVMLARSYYFLKQYQAASDAFARSVSLSQESEPQLLADYADALAMANGRNMTGQPFELVKKALVIDPNHQKSLWLAATATYQVKDYASTLSYWEKLLAQFPEGSDNYVQMLRNIGEVKELMGQSLEPELVAKLEAAEKSKSAGANVSGEVSIDPSLASRAAPTDTVFIFARAVNGPRMPLAILKKQVKDLPIQFTLDDSLAMNPEMKISKFPQVIVSARVTKTGNAMPQAGDLQGATTPVNLGSQGLKIVINNEITAGAPMAQAPIQSASMTQGSAVSPNGAAKISGTVSLDTTLSSRVSPSDTVFVFARAASGPRMPLAIIKKKVADLPISFELDDSMAMNPSMKLSSFPEVIVAARISKSGDAMPQSGDLKGSSSIIKVGSQDLKIIIDSAVP